MKKKSHRKVNAPENPNALKHMIGPILLIKMAAAIKAVESNFDDKGFVSEANRGLQDLELKPRVLKVRDALAKFLHKNYPDALSTLLKSLAHSKSQLSGFDLWPYTEFVQTFGLDDPKRSLAALKFITQKFTGEFAVRPFLKKHPAETLQFLKDCALDANVHVRRLASEGSRPRLPWGERLQAFVKDPSHTLSILDLLKFDDELYVRKSVANHLNDIAKDNPEIVIETLKKWKNEKKSEHNEKLNWILNQSLRSLIKSGHREALSLVGVSPDTTIEMSQFKFRPKKISVGDRIEFSFQIQSKARKPQKLVIDYVIHFQKANGTTAPKVFKLKTTELKAAESMALTKSHHLKSITTRSYYAGRHLLEIMINGTSYQKIKWELNL